MNPGLSAGVGRARRYIEPVPTGLYSGDVRTHQRADGFHVWMQRTGSDVVVRCWDDRSRSEIRLDLGPSFPASKPVPTIKLEALVMGCWKSARGIGSLVGAEVTGLCYSTDGGFSPEIAPAPS